MNAQKTTMPYQFHCIKCINSLQFNVKLELLKIIYSSSAIYGIDYHISLLANYGRLSSLLYTTYIVFCRMCRIEASTSKMSVLQSRQLDLQEEGAAIDIAHFDSGN